MSAKVSKSKKIKLNQISELTHTIFGDDMHAKRIESISNATLGILHSTSLVVHTIGQGLASANGLVPKHAIKQVDRLLSNPKLQPWECFLDWVPYVIGVRKEIIVAMDWTDFDADGHTTLMISLVTRHGRSTPLVWKTVDKSTLKGRRNEYEDELLEYFHDILSEKTKVTVLADRGFGDQSLYAFLSALDFDYVIRFRGNIKVSNEKGEVRKAADWCGVNGRAKTLKNARVTAEGYQVFQVVCKHGKDMKEPWCLVASDSSLKAQTIVNYYAKRWTIEPVFRDVKDIHYGMGMSKTKISKPVRRDKLFLLSAIAMLVLTLLGAAGEALGLDRLLKANTTKQRVHSLFKQGCLWLDLMRNMPKQRLMTLLAKFEELLHENTFSKNLFGIV